MIEMPILADKGVTVEACIADIPYGKTACKWDSVIPFAPMWANLKRLVRRNGAIVLFGSQPFTSALVMSNPQMFRYEWIWEKSGGTGFLDANRRPLRCHENLLVFSDGQATYNPQKERGQPIHATSKSLARNTLSVYKGDHKRLPSGLTGMRFPRTVIRVAKHSETEDLHPTQKPLQLMRYLIRTYTNEGDTVLDFTCGSGSTGVACAIENRNFIGIEKDEHYAEVARARIKRASGIACDIPKQVTNERPMPLFAVNE